MAVKLNEKNMDKIAAMIEEVEGRSYKRTLTTAELSKLVGRLEDILTNRHRLPKTLWEGMTFRVGHSAQVPVSYMGVPLSTTATLTRRRGGWVVDGVDRARLQHDLEPVNLREGEVAARLANHFLKKLPTPRMWA